MAETMLFIGCTAVTGGAVFYVVAMLVLTRRERRALRQILRALGEEDDDGEK